MLRTLLAAAFRRAWRVVVLVAFIGFAAGILLFSVIDPATLISPIATAPQPVAAAILSAIIALVTLNVCGFFAFIGITRRNLRITAALDNMTQGLCMFDANARLIICNERYLEM